MLLSSSSSLKPQDKLKNCSNPQLPVHTYVTLKQLLQLHYAIAPECELCFIYLFMSVCSLDAACTCRTGAIRQGAPEVHRGACGRALLPGACTRAARREASDRVHIRSCATPAGHPAWTARAPTTRDRVASTCCIPYNKMYFIIIFTLVFLR